MWVSTKLVTQDNHEHVRVGEREDGRLGVYFGRTARRKALKKTGKGGGGGV